MSRLGCVVRALPTTFVIYMIVSLLSLGVGTSLGIELSQAFSLPLGRPAARVAAIEQVISLLPLLRAKALDAVLACAALVVASPWLHMAWLCSLSALHGPRGALRTGATLFGRAVVVSIIVATGTCLLLALVALATYGVHERLASHDSDRVHDLAVGITALPGLVCLVFGLAWHDLARARCLHGGALSSALAAFRDASRPGIMLRFIALSLVSLALGATTQLLAHLFAPSGPLHAALLLTLLQGLTLLRFVCRSAWLAEALRCIDASAQPPGRRGSRNAR